MRLQECGKSEDEAEYQRERRALHAESFSIC